MRISLTPTRHLVIGLARARRLEFWDLRRRVVVVQYPCVVSSPRLVDSKCIEANASLIANAQQIPNISRATDSLLLVCPWSLLPNNSGLIDSQYLQGRSLLYPQVHEFLMCPDTLIRNISRLRLWPTHGGPLEGIQLRMFWFLDLGVYLAMRA